MSPLSLPFPPLPLCLPLRLVTPKNTTLPIAIVNAGRTSHQHTEATDVQVSHRLKNASVGTPPSWHRHKKSSPRDHRKHRVQPAKPHLRNVSLANSRLHHKSLHHYTSIKSAGERPGEVGTLLLNLRRDVRVQSSLSVGRYPTNHGRVRRPHPGTLRMALYCYFPSKASREIIHCEKPGQVEG